MATRCWSPALPSQPRLLCDTVGQPIQTAISTTARTFRLPHFKQKYSTATKGHASEQSRVVCDTYLQNVCCDPHSNKPMQRPRSLQLSYYLRRYASVPLIQSARGGQKTSRSIVSSKASALWGSCDGITRTSPHARSISCTSHDKFQCAFQDVR